ncbi:MAG: phospholipid carrier-dependent glycosyltransferase [Phycisphaerae bacterium]
MSDGSQGAQAGRWWVGPLLLALACAGVYANAANNPFHFDDISIILSDPRVQGFDVGELVTGNYWYLPNTDRLYRPVTLLSYAANWAVSQHAWSFRLVNLVMHWGVGLLLVALTKRVYQSSAAAWAAGFLFIVHPLTTEPINTIVGRADLLAALAVLGSAVLYWDDQDADRRRSALRPVLAGVCFALGLLSKENAVTLIGVVVLLDVFNWRTQARPRADGFWRRRAIRAYLPMGLILVAYLGLRVTLLGSLASGSDVVDYFENPIAHPEHDLDAAAGDSAALVRWGTPLATLDRAVYLALAPTVLCFDYSYAALMPVRRFSDGRLWSGLLVVAIGLAACWFSFRRRGKVLVAVGLSALTYSVVSNVVVVIGTIFGERLLYLPLTGYCMLLGLLAGYAFGTGGDGRWHLGMNLRSLAALAVVLVGGIYAIITIDRNADWRSESALYTSAYQVNPRSCKVLVGMAARALEAGELRQGLIYCDRVFNEEKGVAPEYWPAWRTAGVILRRMAEAENDADRKRQLRQQASACFERALNYGAGGDPEAVLGASQMLIADQGKYEPAIRLVRQFVGFRPTNVRALNQLAGWLIEAEPASLRNPQEALELIRRARRLAPNIANYAATEVDVLTALGRNDEAVALIREQLALLPPDSPGVAHFQERLARLTGSAGDSGFGQGQDEAPPPSTTQPGD